MKKRWKRIILYICIMLTCLITPRWAFAMGENASEISGEIEVIMHYSYEDMKDHIAAFHQKYPNVKVKYTCYADYEPNLTLRLESGDYGDVFFIPSFLMQRNVYSI